MSPIYRRIDVPPQQLQTLTQVLQALLLSYVAAKYHGRLGADGWLKVGADMVQAGFSPSSMLVAALEKNLTGFQYPFACRLSLAGGETLSLILHKEGEVRSFLMGPPELIAQKLSQYQEPTSPAFAWMWPLGEGVAQ